DELADLVVGALDLGVEDLLLDRGVDLQLAEALRRELGHRRDVLRLLGGLEAGEEAADAVVVGGQEGEGIHRILRCRDGGGCGGGIGCGPPVTGSGYPRCGGADLGGQLGPSSTWRAASSAAGGMGSASTAAAPPP